MEDRPLPAGLLVDSALAAAAGALLVALLNEARAQLRAREADRDRAELRLARAAVCDGESCSPGGRSAGGCGCDEGVQSPP